MRNNKVVAALAFLLCWAVSLLAMALKGADWKTMVAVTAIFGLLLFAGLASLEEK